MINSIEFYCNAEYYIIYFKFEQHTVNKTNFLQHFGTIDYGFQSSNWLEVRELKMAFIVQ